MIADGTVTVYINDTLSKHSVGDIVYKPLTKVTEHEYLLPLDGQTIDGVTYKRLVDYLGTNVLPNLNGRYLRADTTPGTMVAAGLPNITGMAWGVSGQEASKGYNDGSALRWNQDNYNGAESLVSSSGKALRDITFSASWCNSIYGNSTTVTPLTYTVRAYICYA